MAKITSVDQYLATQPAPVQRLLALVRSTIRKAVPRAEEVISYQIPAYCLDGGTLLFFAGWKKHYSLYPATTALVAKFKRDLAPYEVNDKGTIRFPLDQPVPTKLIARLAKFRANEVAERAKAKATAAKATAAKATKAKAKAKA